MSGFTMMRTDYGQAPTSKDRPSGRDIPGIRDRLT